MNPDVKAQLSFLKSVDDAIKKEPIGMTPTKNRQKLLDLLSKQRNDLLEYRDYFCSDGQARLFTSLLNVNKRLFHSLYRRGDRGK